MTWRTNAVEFKHPTTSAGGMLLRCWCAAFEELRQAMVMSNEAN